ncbi:MAG: hypothetical protein HJJLKODD_02684 [Phycisphaerae bacterium]|nr:hypothetical protein [Phycisphaerae bacterium]
MSEQASSQSELARRLQVSNVAVHKWIKHPTWPFGERGPWDVEQVRQWRKAFLNAVIDKPIPPTTPPALASELDSKLASAMQVERVKLAQVRRKKAELELSILNGERILVEEVQLRWGRIAEELKAALMALPKSVAPLLVNQPLEQIQSILEEQIVRLLTELASKPHYEQR